MNKIEIEHAFIKMIQQYERVIYKICSFYVSKEFPLVDLYQDVMNKWTKFNGKYVIGEAKFLTDFDRYQS
ncbi:MAG: hypothetical protein LBS55_00260 [Prevotellaceae bacterium]|nr:hypothetical protein [Prevotellaceae bacterium]